MFVWVGTILIVIMAVYIVSRLLTVNLDMYEKRKYCSFCGKHKDEVVKIVLGSNAGICDECVQLCAGLIAESHPEWRDRLVASLEDDGPCGPS